MKEKNKTTNLNSRLEYNRCMVPDVSVAEVTHKENEKEIKTLKRMAEMKAKATNMYQKWKKELTRRGVPLKREKQRMPRITSEQLELIDLKRISFEDLEGY